MGQALYRKYRSKKLSEIVGQEHITTTLENALKKGSLSHAYLFTGPRGVGKTSIARILAHEVNQLPYADDTTHLDIIEIDAASNRRIDEIRDLRDRVHIAPTSSKYKVYIIDEVHMLTKEAFNALLKTLEEPPKHVIFILATTEAHKLPETIISRTQRFTFKPVDRTKAIAHLKHIAKTEKTVIDDEALGLIADHGQGSFRDSISLLDQIRHSADKIGLQDVQTMLGIAPQQAIDQLVKTLTAGSTSELITVLKDMRVQGFHAAQVSKQLSEQLRRQLLEGKPTLSEEKIIQLLQRLIDVPASHDPEVLLELILLEALPNKHTAPVTRPKEVQVKPLPAIQEKIEKTKREPASEAPTEPSVVTPVATNDKPAQALNAQLWQDALSAIKKRHNTLYSVARMANPAFDGQTLVLAFAFPFHQKRLNEAKNKQVIAEILGELSGIPVTVTCVIDNRQTEPSLNAPETKTATDDPLDSISNIFGAAEVLE